MTTESESAIPSTSDLAAVLNSPIPEKLWHYTSLAGFHGIATSRVKGTH